MVERVEEKNNQAEQIDNEEQNRIREEVLKMAKNSVGQTQIDFIAKRLEKEMANRENKNMEGQYK